MKTILPLIVALTALGLAGCRSGRAAFLPQETTKYSIESSGKFALLDPAVQAAVTCSGLQERVNPAGRLEIAANVKNLDNHPVELQVRCVFKDRHGFSTGDESPWQNLVLGDGDTAVVRFAAANNRAQNFTVAVRQAP